MSFVGKNIKNGEENRGKCERNNKKEERNRRKLTLKR
jgi:hypothetical protein